jgi:3-phenylpropionate/trans-cinnamate dioxygenase ferredoxin reductase component
LGGHVAAAARHRGLEVMLIDPLELPNERIFGSEIGEFYRDAHAQHGVELVLGEGVESFEGDSLARRVRTPAGTTVECDVAVVGVSVVPRVKLAQAAGASDRERHRRGRAPAGLGSECIRPRRRRQRVASILRAAHPG